jgi:hypothetical protein
MITEHFTYFPMPIGKNTIAQPNQIPSMNHENAVRTNVIKLARRHLGTSQPKTLNRISIVWNPKKNTSTILRIGSDILFKALLYLLKIDKKNQQLFINNNKTSFPIKYNMC